MAKRNHFFVAVFLILFSNTISVAQEAAVPSFVKDSLDKYVNKGLTEWRIPGVAVCVIKNGKVVVMKGYGVKEMGGADKVDENTIFMIGSNTKAFTATAIAMLDAEKKLSLDDNVTKWLPEFKLDNKAAGEQAIIRDMLCHRIGFRTFQGDFTYWTSNLTSKEVVEKMGHIKATYPFRTKWGYTNAGFVVAGEIIEKVSGMSWAEYLKQNLFTPLGMNNTVALSKDYSSAPNKALPHTIDQDVLMKIPVGVIDNLAAAGSIGSSVADMSHWVMAQLDKGKYDGKQIFPASAQAQTWLPHSILGNGSHPFNTGQFALYGLGWFLEDYSGKKIVSHTGGVNGFVTSVTLLPEEKLGVIVFTNTDQNGFFEALKWEIIDAYLGNPYRNYSQVYALDTKMRQFNDHKKAQQYADTVKMNLPGSLANEAYVGKYTNDVYGDMNVVVENNELRMKFSHHPNMYAKLQSLGNSRFYAIFSDPVFSRAIFPFHVENGKVTGVTVKVADFIEYNPYEFKKVSGN